MSIQNVLFICMGNICRSPAAHAVMRQISREQGLGWRIDSCGTDAFHQGAGPDARMQKVLNQHGYSGFRHEARLFRPAMAYEFDLLLAMDLRNYRDVYAQLDHDAQLTSKLYLFRDFDPHLLDSAESLPTPGASQAEVPDPYYNGDKSFQEVFRMIVRTCRNLAAL